ncbi:MAG: zinc dependent phospholipase C family protein [Candidatus Binatus sp.]
MRRPLRGFALATLMILFACAPAFAWDSVTHREITYLAIRALPPSPLKDLFLRNARQLQYFAVQPDVIRVKYGDESEKIRHYIDLEIYGSDPFEALVPDRAAMVKRFGEPTLLRSGTLPWTIVDFSDGFEQEWSRGDCHELLRLAGFLAHYVGDASQPLHTTKHYDGYEGDRGVHARVERTVDIDIRQVSSAAEPQIHLIEIDSVWQTAIAEIRDSNSHIQELLQDDRAARQSSDYNAALMSRAQPMIAGQIARAASVLASIWIYEWKRAGSPVTCESAASK